MESNTSSIYQQFSQSGSTAATLYEKRPNLKLKSPSVKWIKEWVPQDILATGGKCYVLKWVTEETLRALKEKSKEPIPEPEPEPATEVLFLCSYEGCGKTFIDAGALRKHSLIHGERQFVCHYEGCGKKFLDSSKLKRHFLIHTGERDYVCPVEGCGKAFSLDFNLRSHMKTHSQENYHICPYQDCGKRYTHEYKLRNHIASYHEKNSTPNPVKYTRPSEKPSKTPRSAGGAYGSASSDRPFACPYEGCEKTYIHEYKLRLHLRREHPDNMLDENAEGTPTNADNDMDEGSDQDAYAGKRISSKELKQSRPKPSVKMPPAKVSRKGMTTSPANVTVVERPWQAREEVYREEDSEETEDDGDNVEEGWRFAENNEDDDEDTEYED